MPTIHIGSDHRGYDQKSKLINALKEKYDIIDHGTHDIRRTNYNEYASSVCKSVLEDKDSFGVLLCGTGIGMSIMANRYKGIRCALCTNIYTANQARHHNNANVIAIGVNIITDDPYRVVRYFVNAKYIPDETYDTRNLMLDI